jgi:hypothetical protein
VGDILFISYVLNPLNSDVENECNKPTALGVGTFLLYVSTSNMFQIGLRQMRKLLFTENALRYTVHVVRH